VRRWVEGRDDSALVGSSVLPGLNMITLSVSG
jgi:hypothetical protein